MFNLRPITTSASPEPAKTRLVLPSPDHKVRHRGSKPFRTYSPGQEATAHRCHALGHTKAETADIAGLTVQQVHYLWYVKPRQQSKGAAHRASITPLAEIVPDPVRSGHTDTLPGHRYNGQPTSLRTDVIEQVKACRGQRHTIATVAEHFRMKPSTVRYIWYQVGTTIKNDKDA